MSHKPSAAIAGAEAVLALDAAQTLHGLGGSELLPPETQQWLRREALSRVTDLKSYARHDAAKSAAKQVATHCGRAGALGACVDGGFAAVDAGLAMHRGHLAPRDAASVVAFEATSGAVAACCGAATASALVVLTGGAGSTVAFGVGAGVSSIVKATLTDAWMAS